MINYYQPEEIKENSVAYRFNFQDGEPTIEVYVEGSWELACWLSEDGTIGLGYFTESEREKLPFKFDEDGHIVVQHED